MAKTNSTVLNDQHPLHMFALEATWQIENLAFLASKVLDEFDKAEIQAVRTVVDRIKSLNSLLMTSLDDPDTDLEYFADRLGVSLSEYLEVQS
jgi:hypothetical protein